MPDEIDWGQFSGNFPPSFKFDAVGVSIVGTITRIRVANFAEGPVPELTLRRDDGTEVTVLASQTRLQTKLAELRPASGDRIAIVYQGDETSSKPGKSPAKLFDVQLQKAGAGAGSGTPAPAPAPQPEPQPAAAGAAAQSASSLLG